MICVEDKLELDKARNTENIRAKPWKTRLLTYLELEKWKKLELDMCSNLKF